MTDLGFVHVFEPPRDPGGPILLLLHGTGGNEQDLLPVVEVVAPRAGVLSPRGKVLERGMPRFFRRLAEGVFDLDDLKFRTHEMADFVLAASRQYGFAPAQLTALGFSNGANIAASVLLLRPDALTSGVLFRAQVPLVPDPAPALPDSRVLISNGRQDALVSAEETERLASLFRSAGASVTVEWQPSGHQLTNADLIMAKTWLQGRGIRGKE